MGFPFSVVLSEDFGAMPFISESHESESCSRGVDEFFNRPVALMERYIKLHNIQSILSI